MLSRIRNLQFRQAIKWKSIKVWLPVVLLLLAFFASSAGKPGKKRKELEEKRKELQKQIEKNRKELEKVKAEATGKITQLKVIGEQIQTREKVINSVSQEAFEISIEIQDQRKTIESLKSDLRKLKQDYAEYIVAAYKRRQAGSVLFLIFDSKNLNQAFRRLRYLSAYGDFRRRQSQLILNTQMQMIGAIKEMIGIKQEKLGLVRMKEGEKKELIKDKETESKLLGQLQDKEKELRKEIAKQEQASKKLTKDIEQLIAREIEEARKAEEKRLAAARKSKKPVSKKTSNSYLSASDVKLSDDFQGNKGKLPWPVSSGKITETFGDHPHPELKGVMKHNNGVEISTVQSAQVKPVYKGVVKAVFPIPGMDRVVLVSHGEYYTVYARLETLQVKTGDQVTTSTVLGTVATHTEGGTRLHFEIYKQRELQNPYNWLKPQ